MLVGEYQHNIDAKGRMIMPAKFREHLGERFFVTKGLDNCLFVLSQEEWTKLDEKLSALSLSQGRATQRFFYGGMAECELDKQGRILIPASLREFAGLTKDVVVTGMARRVEIWDKAAWEEQMNAFAQNPDDVALKMEALEI